MAIRQARGDANTDSRTAVGGRIRSVRLEMGLSQAEVAEGMLSASYVSLVESGRRQPATPALQHIAERLGVDIGYLRDGVDAEVRRRARLALGHAEVALRQGDVDDAYRRFRELENMPGIGDDQGRQIRMGLALAAERRGDLEEALRDADELNLSASDEYVRLGCTVLAAYFERGDLAKATLMAADLVRIADAMGAPHTRGAAYWNAALMAESRGDIGQALEMLDKVRGELVLHGSTVDVGYCDTERARALLAMGRIAEARAAAEASLSGLRDKPRIESAQAVLLLGRVLREQGNVAGCLEQCAAAAGRLEAMGASRQAAGAWRELGDLYRDLDRGGEALDAYDRALRAVRVTPAAAISPVVGPVGTDAGVGSTI